MTRVYVSVNNGIVAVDWYSPVSHVTAPVGCTDWFSAIVYSWLLTEQEAITSIADGVTESDV